MKTLQVRIPDELRDAAEEVLADIGMDMSTAIRIYLRKVVQSRSIPFALEAPRGESASVMDPDSATQDRMDRVAETWSRVRG